MRKMPKTLGVSAKTIGKRLKELGLSISNSFSCIIDAELDSKITNILNDLALVAAINACRAS